jgi:hypothetical protein
VRGACVGWLPASPQRAPSDENKPAEQSGLPQPARHTQDASRVASQLLYANPSPLLAAMSPMVVQTPWSEQPLGQDTGHGRKGGEGGRPVWPTKKAHTKQKKSGHGMMRGKKNAAASSESQGAWPVVPRGALTSLTLAASEARETQTQPRGGAAQALSGAHGLLKVHLAVRTAKLCHPTGGHMA